MGQISSGASYILPASLSAQRSALPADILNNAATAGAAGRPETDLDAESLSGDREADGRESGGFGSSSESETDQAESSATNRTVDADGERGQSLDLEA